MKEEVYCIEGMTCAACSSAVERVTRRMEGVERSDVNLTTNKMTIVYQEDRVTPEQIIAKVEKTGYGIKPYIPEPPAEAAAPLHPEKPAKEEHSARNNLIGAVILTAALLYISMGQMFAWKLPVPAFLDMNLYPTNFALTQLLLSIPILYFGRRFFTGGLKALFHRNPNMDSLVAIGSGCSFLYSLILTYQIPDNPMLAHHLYYESAAVVITFIMVGKYLEGNSRKKTKGAIEKLMALAPDTALLLDNGNLLEVPTSSLKVGDRVLVRPGARIPLDGTVLEGSGGVDESMLTGESLPVEKTPGSSVIGGSVSYNGALTVQVERVGADTTLAKIIRIVEDAQGKKAPISKIADRVAGVFVPVVIAIAAAAALIWTLAGQDASFILRVFTAVLVIACPCALGLATPTAIMVGTGLGASNGILIRSGEALEQIHKADVVLLDKTGTVTEGKPQVTEIITDGDAHQLLGMAASVETLSDHPLAKAITLRGEQEQAPSYSVSGFENLSGKGIRAELTLESAPHPILVGNRRLMEESGIKLEKFSEDASRLSRQGQTPMYVALDGTLQGIISVADVIKETSREAIADLQKMGVRVVLLTGDNSAAAGYIGEQVAADEVISEVLPEDKAAIVQRFQDEGHVVMMVGDGINDAPALVQADIGASIGTGSDIAIESGDLVLMKSDLKDIGRAFRLSKYTIRNIKQNLFWAFCYNTIGIPIAAGVLFPVNGMLLDPMFAGLAMSLSSVCVVLNALRLRAKKL